MNTTAELQSIITANQDTEESRKQKKERTINDLIDYVKFGAKNLDFKYDYAVSFICLILSILFIMKSPGSIDSKRETWFNVLSWIFFLGFLGIGFEAVTKYKNYLSTLKQLLIEICDKPYEVRFELVKSDSFFSRKTKAKVIIEENLLINGSHVIKEKSKHISAYLDLNQPSDSLITMMVTLAEKAESQFK